MNICQNHQTCIDSALKTAERICRKKKLRLTTLRRQVLLLIWASHHTVKAYDILDKLKINYQAAKPATVYRALDFLLDNGFIHKINSLNSYVACTHPDKHQACYFLICFHCGQVEECCHQSLTKIIRQVTDNHDFIGKKTTLEISGQCKQCAVSEPNVVN